MAYSGGKISKPVRTIDISQAIGVGSRDVGTLCKSTNVNKWALYKPISLAANGPISVSQRISANQGLNIGESARTAFADAIARAASGVELWPHIRPSGGIGTSPYRMLDFDGYNIYAACPFYLNNLSTSDAIIGHTDVAPARLNSVTIGYNTGGNYELPLYAGGQYKYWQFDSHCSWCVLIHRVGDTNAWKIDGTAITNGSFTPSSIPALSQPVSEQGITFGICAAVYNADNGKYYPLPNTYTTFVLKGKTVQSYFGLLSYNNAKSFSGTRVNQYVAIVNSSSTSRLIRSCKVTIYAGSQSSKIAEYTVSNITVPANSSRYIGVDEGGTSGTVYTSEAAAQDCYFRDESGYAASTRKTEAQMVIDAQPIISNMTLEAAMINFPTNTWNSSQFI